MTYVQICYGYVRLRVILFWVPSKVPLVSFGSLLPSFYKHGSVQKDPVVNEAIILEKPIFPSGFRMENPQHGWKKPPVIESDVLSIGKWTSTLLLYVPRMVGHPTNLSYDSPQQPVQSVPSTMACLQSKGVALQGLVDSFACFFLRVRPNQINKNKE